MRTANLACTAALLLGASVCALLPATAWAQEFVDVGGYGGPLGPLAVVPAPRPEPPFFAHGFAALKEQLGELMGEPIELEHPPPDGGADAVQLTSTGLAAWRQGELPAFTDGNHTWALAPPRPAATAGLPSAAVSSPLVECIIRLESGGNPNAVNARSKASGLGQFLPSTWLTTPLGKQGVSVFNAAANRQMVAWMIANGRATEFDTLWGCRR